jgi:thiamine-monophosphate kinase
VPLDELAIIDRFFRPLAGEGAFRLLDDAGLLEIPSGGDIVVTTDMIAKNVHFLADDPPAAIASKALRVNLSDLAAKGATPLSYVLSLGLDASVDEAWLSAFADGLRGDQQRFGITLLGGDTISVPEGPVISIAAFGIVPRGRMVHRSGGKPGDALYVSGAIGSATAGLALLKREAGPWNALLAAERETLVQCYRIPEPRTELAVTLVEFAAAAMDVSDGLVGDCDKLCAASGCSALIEAESVPLPPALTDIDEAILARLITAGDDYEILAAVPPHNEAGFRGAAEAVGVAVTRVGTLTEGSGPAQVMVDGRPLPLNSRAYVHRGSDERP